MNIGEHFREVVGTVRTVIGGPPYYMYGHRAEISARLEAFDKSANNKRKKFPLIMLILDTPEVRQGGLTKFTVHVAICMFVKGERNAEQRVRDTIDAELVPLYRQIVAAICDVGKFTWPNSDGDMDEPPHTKFDRPNWGMPGNEKNERQFLNDAVDAIEMVNLSIAMPTCEEDTILDTGKYFEQPYFEDQFE